MPTPFLTRKECLDTLIALQRRIQSGMSYKKAKTTPGNDLVNRAGEPISKGGVDCRILAAKTLYGMYLNFKTAEIEYRPGLMLEKAARQGYLPEYDLTHEVPPGLTLKGTSIRYDREGNVDQYWNKTKPEGRDTGAEINGPRRTISTATLRDQEGKIVQQWETERPETEPQIEIIRQAVTEFCTLDLPAPAILQPTKYDTDVIPWFQIGDAHIGMLSHEWETGANFDLKIAERELCAAFATLFDECPQRERCVINDLGDATHFENFEMITTASGHKLDGDGRFPKVIRVYIRAMRFIVDRALEKFKQVDVIINQGNHSRTNDFWMAELLRQVYNNDRVHVLDNSSVFIPYRMGNTFVMVHHSDKTKPERLAAVMCNDFRQDWGETAYHYIDVGHLHHKMSSREFGGCVLEMWNTLAAKDKWTHDSGYRALQSITRVDRSKTYGEVGRRVLPINEIRNIINVATSGAYVPPERRLVFTV